MSTMLRGHEQYTGSIFFRGTLPPRSQEFGHVSKMGIEVAPLPGNEGSHWGLAMRHPVWGSATVVALRNVPMPPRDLIHYDPWLSPQEKQQIALAGNCITIGCEGTGDSILRQRKNALRFVRALMGDDGLGAIDHISQRFWSPAQLQEELSHDADLDIQSVFSVHAVTGDDTLTNDNDERPIEWAHTHGLAELGGFDFDIIRPGSDFGLHLCELMRALAFMIVEGLVQRNQARVTLMEPGDDVALIDAATFQRRAPRDEAAIRDDPGGDHVKDRVVLCETRSGLFAKLFGKVRASRWLMQPFPEDGLIKFSNAASDLMAERAKKTYPVLQALADELAEFEFPVIVKLGYQVDGSDDPYDREHLWFEVKRLGDSTVEGTLINTPFHIARMKQGQTGSHAAELLSDWAIMTPIGMINPRQTAALRAVRENREELRRFMKEHKERQAAEA